MVHFMLSVYLHTFMVYINTGLLVHNTKLYQLGAEVCINFFIIIFVLLGIVWDTRHYVKHIKCGPEDLVSGLELQTNLYKETYYWLAPG